jgi:cell wall-associated NlpC family hydrolase
MGRRLLIAAAVLAAVPTVATAATPTRSWALPQIKVVVAHGLMGATDPAAFRPDDPLTSQALDELVAGLAEATAPTGDPVAPRPSDGTAAGPAPVGAAPPDATPDGGTPQGSVPSDGVPAGPPLLPSRAIGGRDLSGAVTMTQLDARLVSTLGLSGAAANFVRAARAAGLAVPTRFGTEVIARLLGLRTNHPAPQDGLELLPGDPATRAEAAYSAAQILQFKGWEASSVTDAASSFALPQYTAWQKQILDTAVKLIGYPYVWGGTSEHAETYGGVTARGGFDCSGFVWRVYKLQQYPDEGSLADTLRGRTTYQMSGEVAKAKRIGLAELEPGDVLFWGPRGPKSKPSEIDHEGIYLGNGWFVHSSGYGVALAQLQGWYLDRFAWARRPLAEAGLLPSALAS